MALAVVIATADIHTDGSGGCDGGGDCRDNSGGCGGGGGSSNSNINSSCSSIS